MTIREEFKAYLNENKNYNKFLIELKSLENSVDESLDSHAVITKTELDTGFKFYYFDIGENKFRVILEVVDNETGINFEQFINGRYTTAGLTNNLTAKETMLLFGTIFYIIKKYSITAHYSIFTDNIKKFRAYMRILTGKGAKNIRYHEIYSGKVVHIEFEIEDNDSWMTKKIKKFKYKTNLL